MTSLEAIYQILFFLVPSVISVPPLHDFNTPTKVRRFMEDMSSPASFVSVFQRDNKKKILVGIPQNFDVEE